MFLAFYNMSFVYGPQTSVETKFGPYQIEGCPCVYYIFKCQDFPLTLSYNINLQLPSLEKYNAGEYEHCAEALSNYVGVYYTISEKHLP